MQKVSFQLFLGRKVEKAEHTNKNINVSLLLPNCLVWFRESQVIQEYLTNSSPLPVARSAS